jgi:hypothetical protein
MMKALPDGRGSDESRDRQGALFRYTAELPPAYNRRSEPIKEFLATSLLELIIQTSTNLPPDVRTAMSLAANQETPGTQSSQALDIILSNVDMAVEDEGPICQDTGMPTFLVHTPVGVNQIRIKKAIHEDRVRDPGSHVASAGERLRGDRHHGCARQQFARRCGAGDRRGARQRFRNQVL